MSRQPRATRAAPPDAPDQKPPTPASAEKRSWLGNAVRALFVSHVRVRRVDGKLGVELDNKPDPQAAESPMRAALKALLDGAPDSRSRLRFLAAVENGLKLKDPNGLFLYDVEPERLRTALRQLDGLAPAKPPEALAALRARLADAIDSRAKKRKRMEMIAPRSDLMRNNRVAVADVAEGGATDFDRLHEQWKGGPKAD